MVVFDGRVLRDGKHTREAGGVQAEDSRPATPRERTAYAKIGNPGSTFMSSQYEPQWLDSMYNNRALVPEHAEHFRRWAAWSSDATRSQQRELDVRYGGGPNEHLDIFPAAPQSGAPVLVFIHGGYWRSLDKRDHAFVAPPFTREGACVVVPNYALCPAVTVPQIVLQMVQALAWTWRNIKRFGGDPDRITVVGHSAGGHLADQRHPAAALEANAARGARHQVEYALFRQSLQVLLGSVGRTEAEALGDLGARGRQPGGFDPFTDQVQDFFLAGRQLTHGHSSICCIYLQLYVYPV
jgi:hypothetical protein